MVDVVTLYRPVGLEELKLIEEAGSRAFPPRLPDQPIFYPVTNEGYATQIARDWNTRHGSKQGFVTRFDVDASYLARFERQIVGGQQHEEFWVPAEELPEFNAHIVGKIEVISHFKEGDAQ
ncbi:ADP-ribosylation/crystallin J1 [uncultured Devosia sp.]|uniref:ADP-ribosylation/crystallin J1 n=1 Tax=uncultured Devosia sp. TaxID=211434 RepID=UPI00262413B6|nr:ADP-ribosylation/crystallin J1 [uncultured Devosia sp.]